MIPKLCRIRDVLSARGVCRTQHYADIIKGTFPHPVKIGPRAVAWPESEVAAINQARISGANEEQLKALVRRLVRARGDLAT